MRLPSLSSAFKPGKIVALDSKGEWCNQLVMNQCTMSLCYLRDACAETKKVSIKISGETFMLLSY